MTPDEVYIFVREHIQETGEPVVTTPEVAEEFGTWNKAARKRLNALVEDGRLGVKDCGGRGTGAYYLIG